jgi:hypothetical protein
MMARPLVRIPSGSPGFSCRLMPRYSAWVSQSESRREPVSLSVGASRWTKSGACKSILATIERSACATTLELRATTSRVVDEFGGGDYQRPGHPRQLEVCGGFAQAASDDSTCGDVWPTTGGLSNDC